MNKDPIGEKGGMNLYAFVYNTPIRWFDSFGREVVFQGDDALLAIAKQLLKGAKKRANDELKKKVAEMEADEFSCKISLTFASTAVFIGSYDLETIDLGDFEKIPKTGGGFTRYGMFMHELVEQWEKQKGKKAFMEAHKEAMRAELGVTGNTRVAQGDPVLNPDGSFNIAFTFTHKINSTIVRDGVKTSSKKTVKITQTITIKDQNIVIYEEQ